MDCGPLKDLNSEKNLHFGILSVDYLYGYVKVCFNIVNDIVN